MSSVHAAMGNKTKTISIEPTGKARAIKGVVTPFDDVELNYAVIEGKKPGPTLLVTAGVHGCEVGGIEAARRLLQMPAENVSGTLVVIPNLNVKGFEQRVPALMPEDGENLNRQFPGKPDGTDSERLAFWLTTEVFPHCDHYIDLHNGDATEECLPFTIFVDGDHAAKALATAFGMPRAVAIPASATSTLNGAASAGLPGIIVEIGGGQRWTDEQVLATLEGIARVMTSLAMLVHPSLVPQFSAAGAKDWNAMGRLVTPVEDPLPPTCFYKPHVHDAPCDGLWKPTMKLGDKIEKGQNLGQLEDVFGNVIATVSAKASGGNIYASFAYRVTQGETLMWVAEKK